MKAKQLAQMIRQFAELAEARQCNELYRFADLIDHPTETTVMRFKRLKACSRYPSGLKSSLVSIQKGLAAGGAKTPARAVEELLVLFAGSAGATLDAFLEEIAIEPCAALKLQDRAIDYKLADALESALNRPSLDAASLRKVTARLYSNAVNKDTLSLIAKHILGGEYVLETRKAAIQAIVKQRHERFGAT